MTLTETLGCAFDFLGNRKREGGGPLRYSPSSPAVSTPEGPPPAMMIELAVGKAVRKADQDERRVSELLLLRPRSGEGLEAPVAMISA